jgi:hypothetical protein
VNSDLLTALAVAYRNDDVSAQERDAVLASMARFMTGPEGETAARILHHRREAQSLQLNLDGMLDPKRRAQG